MNSRDKRIRTQQGLEMYPPTLTDTLKRLAEKFPKRFGILRLGGELFEPLVELHGEHVAVCRLTSDDYDEMAGLLGKRFIIGYDNFNESLRIEIYDLNWVFDSYLSYRDTRDKKLASAAAFTAIAERELKG